MIWFMDGNSQFPSLGSIRLKGTYKLLLRTMFFLKHNLFSVIIALLWPTQEKSHIQRLCRPSFNLLRLIFVTYVVWMHSF